MSDKIQPELQMFSQVPHEQDALYFRVFYAACVLLVAIIAYAMALRYYNRGPTSYGIAQISIKDFSPEMVKKHRIPYVIDEPMPDALALLPSVFRYAYVSKHVSEMADRMVTKAMFTLFHASSDTDLSVRHPRVGGDTVVIKMRAGRVVIVPPGWEVDASFNMSVIELHDIVSTIATLPSRRS